MVNRKLILCLGLILLLSLSLGLAETAEGCVYYFYGHGCTDCDEASAYIEKLEVRYPDLQVQKYELYYQPENAELLKQYFTAYKIPEESQGLPALFLPGSYFVGLNPITTLADDNILDNKVKECPSLESVRAIGVVGENYPVDVVNSFSFSRLAKGALSDAFHPGALAIILLFLILMGTATTFSQLLSYGLNFILSVYAMYFIFSIGLLLWFSTFKLSVYFHRLVGFIAIIYGFFVVKNFISGFRLFRLPEHYKKKADFLTSKIISSWTVLLVAVVASLFSFANVSSVLLSLKFAFKGTSGWMALPIVLFYLLIVISPLIVLMVLFFLFKEKSHIYSEKTENVSLWRKHHHQVLNVVIGFISLIFGLVLLFL